MPFTNRPLIRKSPKGDRTRAQILKTARKLFTQRGYHNTSVYDLFKSAHITKGAFYHHWKAKEDLALTILNDMKSAYEKSVFPLLEEDGRAVHLIERTFRKLAALNSRPDWLYCRLMATWTTELQPGDDDLSTAVHQMRERWLGFWEILLKRAQDQGDLRVDLSPKDLSFLVVSTISGVCLMRNRNGCANEHQKALESLHLLLVTK